MLTSILERFPLLRAMLDFVYPPLCLGCGVFTESRGSVCERCLQEIERYERPVCLNCGSEITVEADCALCREDSLLLFVVGTYTDPLKAIIVNFKFHSATACVDVLAPMVSNHFAERISKLDATALIPIPLHPGREYGRGYNQATVIADKLGNLLEIPVVDSVLHRVKKRKPQSRLQGSRRARNIAGVFVVDPDLLVDDIPARVILVDDVVTSGQTIFEARRVLKGTGCEVVAVIALAHGQ